VIFCEGILDDEIFIFFILIEELSTALVILGFVFNDDALISTLIELTDN
jgi:hypothetical protein